MPSPLPFAPNPHPTPNYHSPHLPGDALPRPSFAPIFVFSSEPWSYPSGFRWTVYVVEEPLVSNSLMVAIKRSQANQRRHPENFHMYQIHNQQQTASLLKVELKHFILSILDDPIESWVLSDAGFQSCDVKLALVQPPVATQASRFTRTRCPPIFLCNLTDLDPGRRSFSFPFSGLEAGGENCRLIGKALIRKSAKNPLLIGSCATEALRDFTKGVQKGKMDLLLAELTGLTVICIEKEISEFVVDGGTKEKLDLKFQEVGRLAEQCSGGGRGEEKHLGRKKIRKGG